MQDMFDDADTKAKKRVGNKDLDVKNLRDGRGILIDGIIYPLLKNRAQTWSIVGSSLTKQNKKMYEEILDKILSVKEKEKRFEIYREYLKEKFLVPFEAADFAYGYSNYKLKDSDRIKGKNFLNLYKNQDLKPMIERGSNPIASTPNPSEDLEVFEVDAEGNIKEEKPKKRNLRSRTPPLTKDKKKIETSDPIPVDIKPPPLSTKKRKFRSTMMPPFPSEPPKPIIDTDSALPDNIESPQQPANPRRLRSRPQPAPPVAPMPDLTAPPEPPPPAPPDPNIRLSIRSKDRPIRQMELDKAKIDEESKSDELQTDNIDDISRHGHQMAIQNVFIKELKDFTFIKNQVKKNQYLNKKDKNIKKEIDLIYNYYSSLFPITAPKEYSEDNCLELKTIEFQYKRNREMERKWKRSLTNMNIGMGNVSGGSMGQNVGIIVNTENMGMSAGQFFQQAQAQPQTQAPQPQIPLNNIKQMKENVGKIDSTGGDPVTTDIKEKEPIPVPQNIKPKNNKKQLRKRTKYQDVKLKIRLKQIKPNLLFTNPRIVDTPPQPMGDLPIFNLKNKNKNRRKF